MSAIDGSPINFKDIVGKTRKAHSGKVALFGISESLQTPQHVDLVKNRRRFGVMANTHFE
jgi:hypothetical protein